MRALRSLASLAIVLLPLSASFAYAAALPPCAVADDCLIEGAVAGTQPPLSCDPPQPDDPTCNPPFVEAAVATFVAAGWVDPPVLTCTADIPAVQTFNHVGGCELVYVELPACVPFTIHVVAVGLTTGYTVETSEVWDPCFP